MKDPDFAKVCKWLKDGIKPKWQGFTNDESPLKNTGPKRVLHVFEMTFTRKWASPDDSTVVYQPVIPKASVPDVLEQLIVAPFALPYGGWQSNGYADLRCCNSELLN